LPSSAAGEALDDFQEAGTCRAVPPDQSDSLAGFDHEIDAIEQRHMAVGERNSCESWRRGIQRRRASPPRAPGSRRALDRRSARTTTGYVDHLSVDPQEARPAVLAFAFSSMTVFRVRHLLGRGCNTTPLTMARAGWMQLGAEEPNWARALHHAPERREVAELATLAM